jgi:hypothetical protein
MKTFSRFTLVTLAAIATTMTASVVLADHKAWDRPASKLATPTSSISGPSYGTPAYRATYSYAQPVRAVAEPSLASLEARRSFSYEPAHSPAFKVGDAAVIAVNNAKLMQGPAVVGTVTKDQRVTITAVQQPWLGASVTANGQTRSGWILDSSLQPAAK